MRRIRNGWWRPTGAPSPCSQMLAALRLAAMTYRADAWQAQLRPVMSAGTGASCVSQHCQQRSKQTQVHSCWEGRSMPLTQQPTLGVAPLPPDSDMDVQAFEDMQWATGGLLNDETEIFRAEQDHYDGVIVDPACLPTDVSTFQRMLQASLTVWRVQRRKGVWLKLPTKNANLVAPAIEAGFGYHHAEPAYVMLTYWLPDSPSTLPANASHQVGIGAFVMNDKGEVLAVQEKNGILKNSGLWKMPTGLINQGEDIWSGAVREVKEETGIDTEFVEVVGIRQGHQVAFDKSDLFFLCVLRPLSSKIVKQESEIAAAQWMPMEEIYAQPLVGKGKFKKMLDLCVASCQGRYKGLSVERSSAFQGISFDFYASGSSFDSQ